MNIGNNSLFKPPRRGNVLVRLVPPSVHLVPCMTGGLATLYKKLRKQPRILLKGHNLVITDSELCTKKDGSFCPPLDGILLLAGRYEYVEVLGQGQSSVVLKAKDTFQDGRPVAIKVLHTNYSILGSQEAGCLRSLNSADPQNFSPILRLFNTFSYGGHFCMVFELLDSQSLTSLFEEKLSKEEKLRSVRKLALRLINAVGFLQSQSVIHADLKPDNLLLSSTTEEDEGKKVKVVDFGNAIHCVHDEMSLYYEDFELQTLLYRAPEVIYGMLFGAEVDMWSVGCILAELFIGRPLFYGKNIDSVLSKMTELLGPLPLDVFQRGKFFHRLESFTRRRPQAVGVSSVMCRLDCSDFTFVDFLVRLLKYDPASRMTVAEAAQHPFLAAELGLKFYQMIPSLHSTLDYAKVVLTPETYGHRLKPTKPNNVVLCDVACDSSASFVNPETYPKVLRIHPRSAIRSAHSSKKKLHVSLEVPKLESSYAKDTVDRSAAALCRLVEVAAGGSGSLLKAVEKESKPNCVLEDTEENVDQQPASKVQLDRSETKSNCPNGSESLDRVQNLKRLQARFSRKLTYADISSSGVDKNLERRTREGRGNDDHKRLRRNSVNREANINDGLCSARHTKQHSVSRRARDSIGEPVGNQETEMRSSSCSSEQTHDREANGEEFGQENSKEPVDNRGHDRVQIQMPERLNFQEKLEMKSRPNYLVTQAASGLGKIWKSLKEQVQEKEEKDRKEDEDLPSFVSFFGRQGRCNGLMMELEKLDSVSVTLERVDFLEVGKNAGSRKRKSSSEDVNADSSDCGTSLKIPRTIEDVDIEDFAGNEAGGGGGGRCDRLKRRRAEVMLDDTFIISDESRQVRRSSLLQPSRPKQEKVTDGKEDQRGGRSQMFPPHSEQFSSAIDLSQRRGRGRRSVDTTSMLNGNKHGSSTTADVGVVGHMDDTFCVGDRQDLCPTSRDTDSKKALNDEDEMIVSSCISVDNFRADSDEDESRFDDRLLNQTFILAQGRRGHGSCDDSSRKRNLRSDPKPESAFCDRPPADKSRLHSLEYGREMSTDRLSSDDAHDSVDSGRDDLDKNRCTVQMNFSRCGDDRPPASAAAVASLYSINGIDEDDDEVMILSP